MPAVVRELKPNADAQLGIVEMLREHLARAESGMFRSVHILSFEIEDDAMLRHSAGDYSTHDVIAALEEAKVLLVVKNIRPTCP